MKGLLKWFRENSPHTFWVVFILMVFSAMLMYFLANAGLSIGLILALGVLVLANLLVMLI